MSEVTAGSELWRDQPPNLVQDPRLIRYSTDFFAYPLSPPIPLDPYPKEAQPQFGYCRLSEPERMEPENLKDQIKGFADAWGELLLDLSRGCRDIAQQSLMAHDSYLVRTFGEPLSKLSGKLKFLNEYLPEDRDPLLAWPVIFCVFVLSLLVLLNVNTPHSISLPVVKRIQIHPPNATRIMLPDGRNLAYHQQGVPPNVARFTLISPHAFLSSRLSGIPGISPTLLREFGIRLITYDLPGFGESDPHPERNLYSSAQDMLLLANQLGVQGEFWLLGHSAGAMHVFAALRYISDNIAGAALVSPMVNPYDQSMTKEEMSRTWDNWVGRRKFIFFLARRFPGFLSYFYRRSFLSGEHGQLEKWWSVSLSEKDKALVETQDFEDHWHRDIEESVRQGSSKPYVEEATLQVSDWGFSLNDLVTRRKCLTKGFLPWLRSIYNQAECDLTGFPGLIHIWQGMNDRVVPPTMTDYISRILPQANVHRLPNEGHFSFLYFCDQCHRDMLIALFGNPKGPLEENRDGDDSDYHSFESHIKDTSPTYSP